MQPILTLKQVTKVHNKFSSNWDQIQTDSIKFAELTKIYCNALINKVPLEFIPFYVDEFYTKVAAMYDAVDTLEFGKLRTDTQKMSHKAYISLSLRGGFLASAYEGEKDVELSHCSCEGLQIHLKYMKTDLENNNEDPTDKDFLMVMDQIEVIENDISNVGIELSKYKRKLVSDTSEALASALHTSKGRRFRLAGGAFYMNGNYGVKEGYKCEYYRKPSGKDAEVKFKTLLWASLEEAHHAHRDLYSEIRDTQIPSPLRFSHDDLIAAYHAEVVSLGEEFIAKKKQNDERLEQRMIQKVKDKTILDARRQMMAGITDPDEIRERDKNAKAHDKYMKSLVEGERVPGDTSNDDDDDDDDDDDGDNIDNASDDGVAGDKKAAESTECLKDFANKVTLVETDETQPQFDLNQSLEEHHVYQKAKEDHHIISSSSANRRRDKKESSRGSVKHSSSSHHRKDSASHLSKEERATRRLLVGGNRSDHRKSSTNNNGARSNKISNRLKKRSRSLSNKSDESSDLSSTDSEATSGSKSVQVAKLTSNPHRNRGSSSFLNEDGSRSVNSTPQQPGSVPTNTINVFPSMLQELEADIMDDQHKKKDKRKKSIHLLDNSVVAEFDSNFPDLDGHPQEDSLLHEIDEEVIRPEYFSDNDAELSDEDHISNVTSKTVKKRNVHPDKLLARVAADKIASEKRAEKLMDAKLKRQQAVFQRRVLESNNVGRDLDGVVVNDAGGEDADDKIPRKRRVTSGLAGSFKSYYGLNMAINQTSHSSNSELITGCADALLGSPNAMSQSSTSDNVDKSVIRSYRKQSGEVCDKVLKQNLMKHLQLEIFKEITFERLITEYSVAKREAAGAQDDEILDIDWFAVMDGFSVNLKYRLRINSRIILERIHLAIDNDNNIISKTAMKERFTISMNAFLRHGCRVINSVATKTVHKIGTHFDALNFSECLPRFAVHGKKTQGYAFAFTASLYNVFDENNNVFSTDENTTLGVDPLLCEIMKSTATEESHMNDIIEYTLIKRSAYSDSPASYSALRAYLEKKKHSNQLLPPTTAVVVTNKQKGSADTLMDVVPTFAANSTQSTPKITSSSPTATNSLAYTREINSSSQGHFHINKQLFPHTETDDDTYGASPAPLKARHNVIDPVVVDQHHDSLVVVLDDADLIINQVLSNDTTTTTPAERVSLTNLAMNSLRTFLRVLLSDVKHNDEKLFMKFNTNNNIRVSQNLAVLKFLETNEKLDELEMYNLFCASIFFKSLTGVMYIPFKLRDQYNVTGDGYCFYRALFLLLIREQSGYSLSADQLAEMDVMLKSIGTEGENLREQFQAFFARIENVFPDKHAKSKAATAACTFSHLTTYLDERFWGGNDSVPFLDYNCTAFSHNRDENTTLSGCWAKMFCSSIPGMMNGRETLDYATVGNAYSCYDMFSVLMKPHNWLLHKQVHFFVGDHPSVEEHLRSFAKCMSEMLTTLRSRISAAKGIDDNTNNVLVSNSFSDVYDRMLDGRSTIEDIAWINHAQLTLEKQLTENNFYFNYEEDETVLLKSNTPSIQQQGAKKDVFLATPFGATQEQKIYISTINNTVAIKESENELLRSQLAGLKEMIARNSVAAKFPTFIDNNE